MNKHEAYVTKADVEEIVGRVVGEIVGDALQLISQRFDTLEATVNRIDNTLTSVVNRLDDYERQLRRLNSLIT